MSIPFHWNGEGHTLPMELPVTIGVLALAQCTRHANAEMVNATGFPIGFCELRVVGDRASKSQPLPSIR
jgi:hypothetical protein